MEGNRTCGHTGYHTGCTECQHDMFNHIEELEKQNERFRYLLKGALDLLDEESLRDDIKKEMENNLK